jgi:hypothetical protein
MIKPETTAIKKKQNILYNGHKRDKHETGTWLYISKHIIDN